MVRCLQMTEKSAFAKSENVIRRSAMHDLSSCNTWETDSVCVRGFEGGRGGGGG